MLLAEQCPMSYEEVLLPDTMSREHHDFSVITLPKASVRYEASAPDHQRRRSDVLRLELVACCSAHELPAGYLDELNRSDIRDGGPIKNQ
jgi:hypothetical protein